MIRTARPVSENAQKLLKIMEQKQYTIETHNPWGGVQTSLGKPSLFADRSNLESWEVTVVW
jgi:hypothetical protein